MPKTTALMAIATVAALLLTGTVAYHLIEGWSWVDSLYFATTSLTTVGYGDLHPTHDASKLFTVFYVLGGVTLLFYFLTEMTKRYAKREVLEINKRFTNTIKNIPHPHLQKKR